TGLVHPDRIFSRGGAKPGDRLVLTKPLGTGVITTAHKNDRVEGADLDAALASMLHLNRAASKAVMTLGGAHALTDITGFGVLGHAHEMAHLSGAKFEIEYGALPWLPGARRYSEAWIFPDGAQRNEDYFGRWVTYAHSLAHWEQRLLYDPQTSGGLLMAIAQHQLPGLLDSLRSAGEKAWMIGAVAPGQGEIVVR
ncbi:MAG: selenide, water dikinase SelD, partial [Acidobacteria bacterium]|nr:selenide, water dikinase SelD [Acidobacteriota bacterium]